MTFRKLNVLVFMGTGTTIGSVRHCIYTLRRLLSPNYAVTPLSEAALLKEPWGPTCAMLVMPGGADLGFCRALNGAGNRIITQYIRRGGRYLGFCAGGYYGSSRCEFEVGHPTLEVVGDRELRFFSGICRGGAFEGFGYGSEAGARAVRLRTSPTAFGSSGILPSEFRSYYNGGGVFVDAATIDPDRVSVLATYIDELDVSGGSSKAAVILCAFGEGQVILTGPHPEFAAANLSSQEGLPDYDDLIQALAEDDKLRVEFLQACLLKLGLDVNLENSAIPSLSKLHLSALDPQEVGTLLYSLQDVMTKDERGEEIIKDTNDTFRIECHETRWSSEHETHMSEKTEHTTASDADTAASPTALVTGPQTIVDYGTIIKTILPHEQAWPEPKATPYFNHHDFFSSLREYRRKESEAYEWGDALMYGEVVTSTNTMLEKNPSLLSKLTTGFTLAATTQVAGRGRGGNVWIAPPGCLIMSTVINHPVHLGTTRPVVFFQYLAAVAIVEAIRTYDPGYEDLPVKLKWPNDIYARDPSAPKAQSAYVKIGGILTNCVYSDGNYQLVLGIGINTTNGRPTTSLDAIAQAFAKTRLSPFRIERLLARLLTRLETMYREFLRHGFSQELEERYYAHWLHSGQIVSLENEGGIKAKISGITRDWGLLKAEEIGFDGRTTGRTIALQSDENSFDFWRGLIKRKI